MTGLLKGSIKLPIIIFTVFIVVILIGYLTFLKSEPSKIIKKGINESNRTKNITMYNVGKFSDPKSWKNVHSPFSNIIGNFSAGPRNWSWNPYWGTNWTNRTINSWSRSERHLPYPVVLINYSTMATYTIRNESAGDKSIFFVLTLDIRNYGYKYFDAHPSKFRIDRGGTKVYPILNVSTDNMLDAVLPNNSRVKGDLIFLVGERETYIGRSSIEYLSKNYTILYNQISSEEMNKVEKDEEEEEETNETDYVK